MLPVASKTVASKGKCWSEVLQRNAGAKQQDRCGMKEGMVTVTAQTLTLELIESTMILSPTSNGCTTNRYMMDSYTVLTELPKTKAKAKTMELNMTQVFCRSTCKTVACHSLSEFGAHLPLVTILCQNGCC